MGLSTEQVDLRHAVRRAKRQKLFASLARIYASFPETECESCARCCFESPGIFFIEYLHLMEEIGGLPRARQELLKRRALGELLFSWVDPQRQCIFLESSRCTLYQRRPLACRLFGLVSPSDREQAELEARLAAREEARRLGLLGIRIPEEIVTRALVSCERVRDRRGREVRVDADAMAARVARLDEALLPRQVVVREFCFLSLPERLAMSWWEGDAVEMMRIQLLRRAQSGERVEDLLGEVWEMVAVESGKVRGERRKEGRWR